MCLMPCVFWHIGSSPAAVVRLDLAQREKSASAVASTSSRTQPCQNHGIHALYCSPLGMAVYSFFHTDGFLVMDATVFAHFGPVIGILAIYTLAPIPDARAVAHYWVAPSASSTPPEHAATEAWRYISMFFSARWLCRPPNAGIARIC